MSVFHLNNSSSTTGASHSNSLKLVHVSPIRVTVEDMERLRVVVDRHANGAESSAAETLQAELDRADVVTQEELPPDVVTMRSNVVYEDVDTGERREARLVYPDEADVKHSLISVLAPIGMALLGLSVGQSISGQSREGGPGRSGSVYVDYQPEAAQDLHL